MNKPHKHAEQIKAWADGAEIQYKTAWAPNTLCIWRDCINDPQWGDYTEYRIKPKTIKYRNFLWKSMDRVYLDKAVVCVVSYEEDLLQPREKWNSFVKWLGDWQEVEV